MTSFADWDWNPASRVLPTWGGRAIFVYSGSVLTGTDIWFGKKPYREHVDAAQYSALLAHFEHAMVEIGASFHRASADSLGAWLQANVARRATASYVGPILIQEGYAERVPGEQSMIRYK